MFVLSAVPQYASVDAFAVVTNYQTQLLLTVRELGLNVAGIRVPEGVGESLAGNEQRLLTNDRVQITRSSGRRRTKLRGLLCCQLLAQG